MADEGVLVAVFDNDQMELVIEVAAVLGREEGRRHGAQEADDFVVGVDRGFAVVGAAPPGLAHHAHEPDDTQEMVDVLVSDKDRPHILPAKLSFFQLL